MHGLALKMQKALDLGGNTHDLGDVLALAREGKAQVWSIGQSIVVTEIIDTPRVATLRFWIAAGDLDSVLECVDRAIEWGKERGCTKAVFHGRKGWQRVLKDWEESQLITMERDI